MRLTVNCLASVKIWNYVPLKSHERWFSSRRYSVFFFIRPSVVSEMAEHPSVVEYQLLMSTAWENNTCRLDHRTVIDLASWNTDAALLSKHSTLTCNLFFILGSFVQFYICISSFKSYFSLYSFVLKWNPVVGLCTVVVCDTFKKLILPVLLWQ